MNPQKKNVRRGGFNVVDALILFLVLAFAVLLIYVMFFSDIRIGNGLRKEESRRMVSYTLEIEPFDEEFLNESLYLPIQVGDRLYHLDGKYTLGEVSFVGEAAPYMAPTGEVLTDEEGNNILQYAPYPGKSVVTLKVEAEAVYNGTSYLVAGKALRVGDSFSFTTPYFAGTCRCTAVEEVTADGGN